MMNGQIDYQRIGFIFVAIAVGVCVGIFAEGNSGALRILVTVLSILTAMLTALIALVGDPQSLFPGSWRLASAHGRAIGKVLRRYTLLAVMYLVTILCAFLASVGLGVSVSGVFTQLAIGLGATALILSLGLPIAIYRAQMQMLDKETERRKSPEGENRDG